MNSWDEFSQNCFLNSKAEINPTAMLEQEIAVASPWHAMPGVTVVIVCVSVFTLPYLQLYCGAMMGIIFLRYALDF